MIFDRCGAVYGWIQRKRANKMSKILKRTGNFAPAKTCKGTLARIVIIAIAAFNLAQIPAVGQVFDYVNSERWGAMAGQNAWRVAQKPVKKQHVSQVPGKSTFVASAADRPVKLPVSQGR
jgi:hypothetical protein